jgi:hypothetical protein
VLPGCSLIGCDSHQDLWSFAGDTSKRPCLERPPHASQAFTTMSAIWHFATEYLRAATSSSPSSTETTKVDPPRRSNSLCFRIEAIPIPWSNQITSRLLCCNGFNVQEVNKGCSVHDSQLVRESICTTPYYLYQWFLVDVVYVQHIYSETDNRNA